MTLHRRCRPGFTLLEMMVVISIIALLAALTVTAVFRVQESQRQANTNHTLRKAQVGLEGQWKAALFTISKEKPTPEILTMTSVDGGGVVPDNARARALHTKLLLRREFPQNYAEVRYQFPRNYQQLQIPYGHTPSNSTYFAAIGNGSGTPEIESAALLMVTLSKGRGGVNFNIEEIGPTQTIDVGGKPMKVLVDEWGTPICMRRWVTDDQPDILAELNSTPHVTQEQITMDRRDPDDPDRKLKPNWNANAQFKTDARLWFTTPLLPKPVEPFDGMNRGPYLVSAGKDKIFGTADDMYSFRIQGEGRGN